jgi:hypothetical protein
MRRHVQLLSFAALLCVLTGSAAPASAQGNSVNAHWVLDNVAPGMRGSVIRQGAHGTPVIPTTTPTQTRTQTATETPTPSPTGSPTNTLPPTDCADRPDGSTCDAGLDFGNTLICVDGECVACVPSGNGLTTRFVDNGDRTITDTTTCLVWEKKTGGFERPHGAAATFTYSTCGGGQTCIGDPSSACPPDGTAFTEFLASLNGTRFAGHGDWRLPSSAGSLANPTGDAPELESLVDLTQDCHPGPSPFPPCIHPIFSVPCPGEFGEEESCTLYGFYASGSASPNLPRDNFLVWFGSYEPDATTPLVVRQQKNCPNVYRAVRGGVVFVP